MRPKAAAKKQVEEYSLSYMEFYPVIYSSVLTRVGNREDTDDICQEIFLIFYDKFDSIENRRGWLFGTMKNVLYNHYRKSSNNITVTGDFDDVGVTFTNGFRDTRIIIGEAIENMECTDEERTILDMVATFNFTYSHVGEVLGWSRRQVEYRYGTLVKRIQDYLGQKGIKDIAELL